MLLIKLQNVSYNTYKTYIHRRSFVKDYNFCNTSLLATYLKLRNQRCATCYYSTLFVALESVRVV